MLPLFLPTVQLQQNTYHYTSSKITYRLSKDFKGLPFFENFVKVLKKSINWDRFSDITFIHIT